MKTGSMVETWLKAGLMIWKMFLDRFIGRFLIVCHRTLAFSLEYFHLLVFL